MNKFTMAVVIALTFLAGSYTAGLSTSTLYRESVVKSIADPVKVATFSNEYNCSYVARTMEKSPKENIKWWCE